MKIQVYKKKTIPHYYWTTQKIFEDDKGVICFNHGPRDLVHQTRDKIFTFQTDVIEYYWYQTHFSVHISLDHESNELHYYANIHSEPHFEEEMITFIDYDLDVVRLDESPAHIVDQDEFIQNGRRYHYSDEIKQMVPRVADFFMNLLNQEPLFQKERQIDAFRRIEEGERDFLSQWTSFPF